MERIALLAVLFTTGCGGDSPTESVTESVVTPFAVNITASLTSESFNEVTNRFECQYILAATATGGQTGDNAAWTSGEVEIRLDSGTTQTFILSSVDMQDFWGSDRLASGTTQTATRFAFHPAGVFAMAHTFRLTFPDGSDRSISAFTC